MVIVASEKLIARSRLSRRRRAAEREQQSRHIMIVLCGRRRPAADPIEQIGVAAFEQPLITIELAGVETIEVRLGEATKNQVALARSTMPRPEQQTLAADIGWGGHVTLLAVSQQGYRDPVSPCQPELQSV
jgi:hypothetical protein